MKKGSTLFLKSAIILIGVAVLAHGIFGLYQLFTYPVNQGYAHILYPIFTGIYISVIPFFVALYLAFRLLGYIDENKAFSQMSVKALMHIKYCAIVFSIIYVLMLPFSYLLAKKEDAPGLVIIGMIPAFAAIVISVFAAVLQRLFKEAFDIKSENDLTI